jgi:hypothetical protein
MCLNKIHINNKTDECTILTNFILAYFPSPYTCFGTLKFHLQGLVLLRSILTHYTLKGQDRRTTTNKN